MPQDFKLPELGEGIESGDVASVMVSEGDTIQPDQVVMAVETDKASVDVPCPIGGKVTKLAVKEGDTIDVGQLVLQIASEGEDDSSDEGEGSASAEKSEAKEETKEAKAGSEDSSEKSTSTMVEDEHASAGNGEDFSVIPAGPNARRIARELGVPIEQVRGTGKRGRITQEDVYAAASSSKSSAPPSAPPAARPSKPKQQTGPVTPSSWEPPPGEKDRDKWGPIRRDKLPRIRRTISEQMTKSWTNIPHVTNFDDADVTDLDQLRRGVPPEIIGANVKLTTMPFLLKAVALSLKQRPLMNASIDLDNGQIIYKEYVHLGIAVDTPKGLVVPPIRDVDKRSIPELARELSSLADRTRSGDFSIEDLRGGTFTISNLGAIGGTYSTPIINAPEVAILLLGRSRKLPMVQADDSIKVRLMMPLSLSYDHRLIDGAEAARFLNLVKGYLQNPGALLLAE
ncbi:Dihydrolipoyllysine-residue acetyltransferase component of pyruvate dehydrogenase complex [Planctomycetales bacterium 10988]|nr:Dihydrolipoyllysine-residue acetyltransferase component of pyruvate dehydrogenase complex [Planctomycetales bacterium 10988]